LINQIRWAR